MNTKGKKQLDTTGISDKIDKVLEKIIGVMLVAFLGLFFTALAPVIDAWRFRAASYEALDQRVSEQNELIKDLKGEIEDLNTALGVKKTIEVKLPESIDVRKNFSVED